MDNTQKYVQHWLPNDSDLANFYAGIDSFLEINLQKLNDIESETPKIIADPLLGYIYFTPLEIAIIDTPLFQRLRKIKQLGLAYLVFPSLGYSRFEHSLGVLGRLNQILNKLIENYGRNNPADDDGLQKVIKKFSDPVRLAALMHDIGHCIFSHCSERVIHNLKGDKDSKYPSVATIRKIFTDHYEKEKLIPIAEIFSITIIGSKKFHDYIHSLEVYRPKEITTLLENASRFILGLPVKNEPHTIFLTQLISSGLDADKIDYMVREQHYSGIKLEIDLDRILSKLNVFDLDYFELPKHIEYVKKHFDANKKCKVLGFSKGGQFVFEEFCIARLALNVKIYLHQKVRAAESQLSTYLEGIAQNENQLHEKELQKAHNWLKLCEGILEHPELIDKMFEKNNDLFSNSASILTKIQIEQLKKIDNRILFLRAFAFGQINSFSENRSNSEDGLHTEIENFFEQFDEVALKNLIVEEATNISNFQQLNITAEDFKQIIVDIPKLRFKSIQQGHESLYFERPFLSPLKWTIPLDKIVVYFEENRALGYIFSPKKISHVINMASEKVIFTLTKKVFNQEGNVSKQTYSEAMQLKKWLSENKYYKKLPQLREISSYLKSAEAAEKIKQIHDKLSGFESLKKERITINRIMTFANQFPIELQKACLEFLQQLEIYNELMLENELRKVFDKIENKVKIGLAYLGAVSDSGGRISYNLRDLFEEKNLESREINDSLVLNSDVLVIYDDNINSGMQLLNILAELTSEKDKLGEYNLNEKHVSPLTNETAIAKIKNMPIHFCFIIGYEGIEDNVKKLLEEKIGFNTSNINIHINIKFKKDEKIFSGSNSKFQNSKKIELRDFLVHISRQLLKSDGKNNENIEKRTLGYANAEAMALFPYNIPTMTITALWHNGELEDGEPWIPIAERRRRKKDGKIIGED